MTTKLGKEQILNEGVTLSDSQTLTNKTLTSPKIGTAILDTNGNEIIKTPATASAVNEVTVTNAATGGVPTISATGDDANIHLALTPKGSGLVKISVLEQDFTTNVYHPLTVILTGYTSVAANGATGLQAIKTVTYGITFATAPIVIVSYAGWKNNADFNAATDGSGGEAAHAWSVSKTTGGLSIYSRATDALASTYRYGFHWIAIGTL